MALKFELLSSSLEDLRHQDHGHHLPKAKEAPAHSVTLVLVMMRGMEVKGTGGLPSTANVVCQALLGETGCPTEQGAPLFRRKTQHFCHRLQGPTVQAFRAELTVGTLGAVQAVAQQNLQRRKVLPTAVAASHTWHLQSTVQIRNDPYRSRKEDIVCLQGPQQAGNPLEGTSVPPKVGAQAGHRDKRGQEEQGLSMVSRHRKQTSHA